MITNIGKYYLYRHIRLDTNEVFYVGIGTKKDIDSKSYESEYCRAYQKNPRNNFWKNIVSKTSYKIEIILESENHDFIKQKEKEFVKLYGRKDLKLGTLCNLTEGGDGVVSRIVSQETKNKISESNKGKTISKEAIQKRKDTLLLNNYKPSTTTNLKISNSNKGKVRTNAQNIEQSNRSFPIKQKEEAIELYKNGLTIENIAKVLNKNPKTISRLLNKENLVKSKYTIQREDGLKFKTEKDACKFMNVCNGCISTAIGRKIRCRKFYWYKINEFIETEII